MESLSIKLYLLIITLLPSLAMACIDSDYEKQLRELKTLTPSVSQEEPSQESLVQFFNAMPTTFSCFNRLFGYSDKAAPLYSEPQLYFLFPKFKQAVAKEEYMSKLVSLAINARWEADQTGALQDAVRELLDNHTVAFIQAIEGHDNKSQESIWAFLFGGPHPSNQRIKPNVKTLICETSDYNCATFQKVYALKVSEEHNH
jgi:hypothetical protein